MPIDVDGSNRGGDFASSGRARTAEGLRSVLGRFSSPQSLERAMAFAPRPDDVFVATYSKSGTTLLQQIVHGLRTGGDMDFRDISEVVPWIEVAHDLEQPLDGPQVATPRAFKTHLDADALGRGGRVVYVAREPIAVLVSLYHFYSGWFLEPGALDLERFALDYVLGRDGRHDYWHHLASWWPRLADENVLALCYEDVVADLSKTVTRVARFIGVPLESERLAIATHQADKDFMARHPDRWKDVRLREYRNPVMGLPVTASGTKVRVAESADERAAQVTEAVRAAWRARWADVVEPVTGCADYEALREAIASR